MYFFRKYFLFFVLFLSSYLTFAKVLDDKGMPLPEVLEIFEHLKPLMNEEQKALLQDPNLEKINKIAQQSFLRPSGLERKDLCNFYERYKFLATPQLRECFGKIGDIGSIFPRNKTYRYILFNGSTVQNMRQRLFTLAHLIEEGRVVIDEETQLVILSGQRDLFDTEDEKALLDPSPFEQEPTWAQPAHWPKVEVDAAKWIFDQGALPHALKEINICIVDAPKNEKLDSEGNAYYTRPTTQDTFRAWIQNYNPTPGTCLSISSQPFVYYQDLSMRILKHIFMMDAFEIETIGIDKSTPESFPQNLPIYLDNLARTIYSELTLDSVLNKNL